MSIPTNRLSIDIHYEAIFQDFDIFCITPNLDITTEKEAKKIFRDRSLVDAALHDLRALSSAYNNHAEAFLLFPKSDHIDEETFRTRVEQAYPKFTSSRLRRDQFLNPTPERSRRFYYNDRVIAQLLINSLANYTDEGRFHNLSAALLHLFKEKEIPWKDNQTCKLRTYLEFRITAGMYLKASVRTFRSIQGKDNMHNAGYVFDPDLCELRRALPDDGKDMERFEEKALRNKRTIIPYLDFSNLENFKKSRAGQMFFLQKAINERLGKYLHASFQKFTGNTSIVNSKFTDAAKMFQRVQEHFHARTIYVQNRIGEDGKELLDAFEESLKHHGIRYKIIPEAQNIPPRQPAVILLHPKEWYEEQESREDPYLSLHESQKLLQILTDEILSKKKPGKADEAAEKKKHPYDAVFLTVLKELWIKEDILQGQFTFPIQEFHLTKPWYFVYAVKEKESKMEKKHERETDVYTFYRMKLSPDGKITFDSFTNLQPAFFSVEGTIQDIYRMPKGNEYLAQDEQIEGIMYCDEDNLHKLIRTNWWALPNLQNIYNALRFSDGNREVKKQQVQKALAAFQENHPEYAEDAKTAGQKLSILGETFHIKDLRDLEMTVIRKKKGKEIETTQRIFSGRKLWVQKFSKFWFESEKASPILLSPLFTTTEDMRYVPLDYGISEATNIQTFVHSVPKLCNHLAIGSKRIYARGYLSGIRTSRMHSGYARGTIVRNIIPEEGKPDQSEEILPFLDVDFVTSNDMFTVLPFPFKYLREYAAYCEHHGIRPKV